MSANLKSDLLALAVEVRREVGRRRAAGLVRRTSTQRVEISDFKYDPVSPTFSARQVLGSQEAWTGEDIAGLCTASGISTLIECCVDRAVSEFQADRGAARSDVDQIVFALTHGPAPAALEVLVESVIAELSGRSRPWSATQWLNGIGLACERLNIFPGVDLCQTQRVDLEIEEHGPTIMGHAPLRIASPTAVSRTAIDAFGPGEVQRTMDTAIDIVRLYCVTSIVPTDGWMQPVGGWWNGGRWRRGERDVAMLHATLHSTDGPALARLSSVLFPILIRPGWERHGAEDPTPEQLALRRYREALLTHGDVEARMTTVVTCLEALFVRRSDGKQGRLSRRVASTLSRLGQDRRIVQGEVAHAYEIRSAFAHGETILARQRADTEVLLRRLIDIARQCLVFRLTEVGPGIPKEQFIQLVDSME